ncbi:MAG: DUF5677 domain-containing protein [Acidobacteriota bacterium]
MSSESKQEQWFSQLQTLFTIGEALRKEFRAKAKEDLRLIIMLGYLHKVQNTLGAILLLAKFDLWDQVLILVRTIFELRVTFDFFFDMYKEDPENAVRRVCDAMLLQHLKQLESTDFFSRVPIELRRASLSRLSTVEQDRATWERLKQDIESRYSAEEFRAIRKYGFTMMSVEARCKRLGHEEVYNIVYRAFSQNVHAIDFKDLVGGELVDESWMNEYTQSRNVAALDIADASARMVIGFLDAALGGLFDRELSVLGAMGERLRNT